MSHRTSTGVSRPWLRMVMAAGHMVGVQDRAQLADMRTSMCDLRAAYYLDEDWHPDQLDPHTGYPLVYLTDGQSSGRIGA